MTQSPVKKPKNRYKSKEPKLNLDIEHLQGGKENDLTGENGAAEKDLSFEICMVLESIETNLNEMMLTDI